MSSLNVLKISRWDTRNLLVSHVQPSSLAWVDRWDIVVHNRRLATAMTKRNRSRISATQGLLTLNLFCNLHFRKTFVQNWYINLFSHRNRESFSRFVNTARLAQGPTHDHYCSILQSNLVIEIEDWYEKPLFDLNLTSSNEEWIKIMNNKTKSWFLGKTVYLVWL